MSTSDIGTEEKSLRTELSTSKFKGAISMNSEDSLDFSLGSSGSTFSTLKLEEELP